MNSRHRFEQLDVFGANLLHDNPVAVVFDAARRAVQVTANDFADGLFVIQRGSIEEP